MEARFQIILNKYFFFTYFLKLRTLLNEKNHMLVFLEVAVVFGMFIIANEMKCTIYCIKLHVYWDKRKDVIRLSRVLWATIEKVHLFSFLTRSLIPHRPWMHSFLNQYFEPVK